MRVGKMYPGHARLRLESYRGGRSLPLHRPPEPAQRGEFGVGQHDPRRGDVLLQMRHLRRAGDWQHDRAALQHPGERDLAGRGTIDFSDRVERRAWPGQLAGAQREPGNEADAVALAMLQHILARPVGEIVAVLHRRDAEQLRGRFDLLDRDFAQTGMADDALVEQRLDRAELLVPRHAWIDAVQLPEIDLL